MNVVLIETSGNQHFIFATNKLRENVGASELTYQICTKYVLQAVAQETGKTIWVDGDKDGSQLRANLLNSSLNPPIENAGTKIEVVVATSGKAILLVKEQTLAEKIVCEVTKNALLRMPGLTVHGAIETVAGDLSDIHEAVVNVHHKLENLRYKIPSNQQRFPRLPHVEPCATSGLPAMKIYRHNSLETKPDELKPHSSLSIKKQETSKEGRDRLEKAIQTVNPNVKLMDNINELENTFKKTQWLAIIHADGNGLGEIFLRFDEHTGLTKGKCTPRKYVEKYRRFSLALDVCTINAAASALKNLQATWHQEPQTMQTMEVPAMPVVLGGDDLTLLCDGQYALKFVYDFLGRFERETNKLTKHKYLEKVVNDNTTSLESKTVFELLSGVIPEIASEAFGVPRLGVCAGIAIVKPHYPFHQAYELTEQLLKSAKQVKTKVKHEHGGEEVPLPCSVMDFHVLYDSSGVELNEIRGRLIVNERNKDKEKVESQTYLYAKPYVVTPDDKLKENLEFKDGKFTNDWLAPRTWDRLASRVCALRAPEDDDKTKRKLPNSQMHHIRESLHRGQRETDSEVNLFSRRYEEKGFHKLLWKKDDPKSLFFQEKHGKGGVEFDGYTTHFLDALDVVEFWKGFECDGEKEGHGTADGNAGDGGHDE